MYRSELRQSFSFSTADFWSSLTYESAEQKPKHLDLDMYPKHKGQYCLTIRTGEVVEGSHGVVAVGETGLADPASGRFGADRTDAVINGPCGKISMENYSEIF